MRLEVRDALRRGDEVEEHDLAVAELLELAHGVDGAAARGEHRVDHDRELLALRRRHLRVVGHRLGGLLVALHAQHADLGVGQHVEHRIQHPHARAQNRHEHDLLVDHVPDRLRHGRLDLDGLRAQALEGLEREELGDFVHELAEEFRGRALVAHEGHAMVDERMLEDGGHGMRSPRARETALRSSRSRRTRPRRSPCTGRSRRRCHGRPRRAGRCR